MSVVIDVVPGVVGYYYGKERIMLYEQVMALYPELTQQDFMTVITLQNDSDGKGDYIAKWEHTLPRPNFGDKA
jgi:hypothetical protein